MLFQWFLAGLGALAATTAVVWARRTSKRFDRLRESYWDLRYEFGQLQARVARLEADRAEPVPPPPAAAKADAFVPLSSLKR